MPETGSKQKYVIMLDSDGCIYNSIYFYLFCYLIAKHGPIIFQEAKKLEFQTEVKNELRLEVKRKVKEIRQDLGRFLLEQDEPIPDEGELMNLILSQHGYGPRARYTSKQVSKIIHQTIQYYREYLLVLGLEGEGILTDLVWMSNQSLVKEIRKGIRGLKHPDIIFVSGSSRQSYHVELTNFLSTGMGLFCQDLTLFANRFLADTKGASSALSVSVEPILLADIYGGLAIGESYQRALQEDLKQVIADRELLLRHANYVFDHTKFSLLYAVTHYLAIKYQKTNLIVNFFEDREDIHHTLSRLYSMHPDLLPKEVTLQMYQYAGEDLSARHMIVDKVRFNGQKEILQLKGEGNTDFAFIENVKRIPVLCGQSTVSYHSSINSALQMDMSLFRSYCGAEARAFSE